MENARIAIVESVSIPAYVRFEIRDPFGNRIEFIQPTIDLATFRVWG